MNASATITAQQVWSWLGEIPDPEIPVISITDLGIVRDVTFASENPEHCLITVTPTYSGCPATEVIAASIRQHMTEHGITDVDLRVQLSPPWTTDWLSDNGRKQLRDFGIAPPSHAVQQLVQIEFPASTERVTCPLCGSVHTHLLSQFSSTPCKALYRCVDCREPFDYFKVH